MKTFLFHLFYGAFILGKDLNKERKKKKEKTRKAGGREFLGVTLGKKTGGGREREEPMRPHPP